MSKATNNGGAGNKSNTKTPAKSSLYDQAKKIAKDLKSNKIYANSKGEFFTDANRAALSDKKENIKEFDFTKEVSVAAVSAEAEDSNTGEADVKYTVTAEDLEKYPLLAEEGITEGRALPFNPAEVSADQLKQLLGK